MCLCAEGPTHSGVEQYEVMDVDEEGAGADGPGPQRCESVSACPSYPRAAPVCLSVCPSVCLLAVHCLSVVCTFPVCLHIIICVFFTCCELCFCDCCLQSVCTYRILRTIRRYFFPQLRSTHAPYNTVRLMYGSNLSKRCRESGSNRGRPLNPEV